MKHIFYKSHFDVVLVWRYECFIHLTMPLVNVLKEFQALKVDFMASQQNTFINQTRKKVGNFYGIALNYLQQL